MKDTIRHEAVGLITDNEEEKRAIERLARGELGARRELIELNIWVARYSAKKYAGVRNSYEDLLSVAFVGLVKAMNHFDPSKNVKPSSFAAKCINNELLMYLRKDGHKPVEISLEQALGEENHMKQLRMAEGVATDSELILNEVMINENKAAVNMAMGKLNYEERLMVKLRFGIDGEAEHTQSEVAELLKVSQSYVSKKEKALLKKIRDILEQM